MHQGFARGIKNRHIQRFFEEKFTLSTVGDYLSAFLVQLQSQGGKTEGSVFARFRRQEKSCSAAAPRPRAKLQSFIVAKPSIISRPLQPPASSQDQKLIPKLRPTPTQRAKRAGKMLREMFYWSGVTRRLGREGVIRGSRLLEFILRPLLKWESRCGRKEEE